MLNLSTFELVDRWHFHLFDYIKAGSFFQNEWKVASGARNPFEWIWGNFTSQPDWPLQFYAHRQFGKSDCQSLSRLKSAQRQIFPICFFPFNSKWFYLIVFLAPSQKQIWLKGFIHPDRKYSNNSDDSDNWRLWLPDSKGFIHHS